MLRNVAIRYPIDDNKHNYLEVKGLILPQINLFLEVNEQIKKIVLAITILAVLAGAMMVSAPDANAAVDTCTWTGSGGNANMSTAGNWTGCDNGNVPQDGDTLVFPTGPTNKTVTVDSDMAFASVTFSGSDYAVSSAAIEQFGIYSSLTISGNNNILNTYLRFYPSTTSTFTHSATSTDIAHYIVIQPLADDTDVIFNIDSDVSVPMIAQTAVGMGSSVDTVTKSGAGTLDITGTAIAGVTTSNGIHIEEGAWKCNSTHCLGATSNEIILDEGGDDGGAELRINHSAALSNPITSATVTGGNGSVIISGSPTLSGDITVTDSLNMFVSGSNTATIDSDITIADGKTLVSYGADGYTTNAYTYSGVISGDGGLIVDDAHVTLTGTNTYTGDTEITDTGSGGVLSVTNESGLGTTGGKTIANSGTTLNFSSGSDQTYSEPLEIAGTGVGGDYEGAIVNDNSYRNLAGNITLTGNATVINNQTELVVFSGQIAGDFDLTLVGGVENGSFGISPSSANTYGNTIAVGTQLLLNGAGITGIPGNLTMNAVDSQTSRIWMNNDNTIADDSVITLNNSDSQTAYLLNMGVVDTVGTIAGDGTIYMGDSDSHLLIGGNNTDGTFEGVIQGYTDSQFEIVGGGTWTFSGDNTDVGDGFSSYYVNGGTFIADAINTGLGFSPFSISDGVLGGTGVIGQVSAYAGTIAPGNSPGCLNPDGDVAFTEFSTLAVQINSTEPCTGYDFLSASGAIALNDAQLTIELPVDYASHYGDEFMIVQGSSLSGTFAGLADGDTVTVGDYSFRINYTAREVILTDITPTVSASSPSSDSDTLANTGANIQMLIVISLVLISSAGITGLEFKKIKL